jgi:ATP-dependent protease HslVU (ClpYQ) peptidase subunit
MTCIVGYVKKGTVTIGGDSAGVGGLSITHRKDPKVFVAGPFIMGFTSSFRMGQLLMSSNFKPPHQKKDQSDYDFMVTSFVDSVKKCFDDGGYSQKYTDGDDKGGTFLVGYKGTLYMIENDFQVSESLENYESVGCGEEFAKGVLFAIDNEKNLEPREKIKLSLEAATHFSGGVRPPYNFVDMSKDESEEIASKIKKEKKKEKKDKKKKKKS